MSKKFRYALLLLSVVVVWLLLVAKIVHDNELTRKKCEQYAQERAIFRNEVVNCPYD